MSNYVLALIVGSGGVGLIVGFALGAIDRRALSGPYHTEVVTVSREPAEPAQKP